jgi:hypothetical protein
MSSATAYADGEDGLYKNKSECWKDAHAKYVASGADEQYHCEYVERSIPYGTHDCQAPRDAPGHYCTENFWELKEDGGAGPHLPEE